MFRGESQKEDASREAEASESGAGCICEEMDEDEQELHRGSFPGADHFSLPLLKRVLRRPQAALLVQLVSQRPHSQDPLSHLASELELAFTRVERGLQPPSSSGSRRNWSHHAA